MVKAVFDRTCRGKPTVRSARHFTVGINDDDVTTLSLEWDNQLSPRKPTT